MQKYKVKIKKIVPIGKCKAYDLHVNSNTHSYVANGFITHNSLHCIDGETIIKTKDGGKKIQTLYGMQENGMKLPKIYNKNLEIDEIEKVHYNGKQEVFELDLGYGTTRKIICTEKHKFLTDNGWKKLKELKEGDEVYTIKMEKGPNGTKKNKTNKKKNKCKKRIAWNKGKKMYYSNLQKAKMTETILKAGKKTRYKKGNIPHNKGKDGWGKRLHEKYPEIHPNVILNKNGRISYKQKELYKIIKKRYKSAKMNYKVKTKKSFRFPDVAIPRLKLDFEYDGEFWHNKEEDIKRDRELEEVGWKTIRINKNNFKKFKEEFPNATY